MTIRTSPDKAVTFARFVVDGARINREHIGNRLMDSLKAQVADVVREQEFNPRFIDDMTLEDAVDWLNDHIVFDNKGDQVAVVDHDELLWKAV